MISGARRGAEARGVSLIELAEVSKVYRRGPEEIQALQEVDLKIASGEFVAITGKSGCGKSTLLHIIGGLEPASRGRVLPGRPGPGPAVGSRNSPASAGTGWGWCSSPSTCCPC